MARSSDTRNANQATSRAMSSEPGKSDKKPAKPQPTLGLEFITSVGSIDRDDATRRKVRSHAKRSALKSSRETRGTDVPGEGPLGVAAEVAFSSTSSSLPVRPAPIQQSREAGTSKFKLVDPAASGSSSKVAKRKDKDEKSLVRRRRDAAPSEEAIVGGSSLDAAAGQSSEHGDRRGKGSERIFPDGRYPMDADFDGPHPGLLPADMNPATAELLKFYKAGFWTNSFPLYPEGTWFEFVRSDPALLHALLSTIAALHGAGRNHAGPGAVSRSTAVHPTLMGHGPHHAPSIDYHRSLSVRHINHRLNIEGRSKNKPISDGIIVAVSVLVNTEAIMGSFEAASAHMSGLKHMCSLRGGLEALSHSPMLQRTVTWCDFAYSTAFCRPLIFPLLPNLCHTFPLLNRFLGIGDFPSPPESENPAAWPGGLELNDPEAIDFLETLAVVAERINDFDRRAEREGWAYRGAGGKDAVWRERRKEVSDAIYLLEYRLCTMEARTNWGGGSPWDMQLAGPPGTTAPSDDLSMTHIFDFSLPAHMAHKHSVGGELPLDPELLRVGEREPLVASSVQIPLHPPQHPQTTTDLSPALKWAVHLFLHIAIRGQPPAAKRHRTMCERMMGAIWPVLGRLDLLVDSYPFGAEKGTYDPESGISSADYVEMRSMAAASQLDMHSCILAWILFVGCCIRDPLTHSYPLFQSQSHLRPPIYTVPSSPSVGLAASGSGQAQSSASSLHYPQPPVTPVDAVPQTYRDLFLPLLRRLCERRGIITKPALETVLARVVWYEKLDWSKRQVYMLWGDLGVGMGYATEIFEGV